MDKTNINNSDTSNFKFTSDYKTVDFLVGDQKVRTEKRKRTRLTKAEAFFDLLSRQRLAISTNDERYINDSIQQLAEAWGWQRPTASKFINKLVELGAIKLAPHANKSVVRINYFFCDKTSAGSAKDRIDDPDGHNSASGGQLP